VSNHCSVSSDVTWPPYGKPHVTLMMSSRCESADASAVTYQDVGVEATFAPELVRVDQVVLTEAGAAVRVGQTVIRFAADATITPAEARKLAVALVELADYADGTR
jgi:hypothetical protein